MGESQQPTSVRVPRPNAPPSRRSYAYAAGASGYLAGRAIWWKPLTEAWAQGGTAEEQRARCAEALQRESQPYMARISELTKRLATPYTASAPPFDGSEGYAFRKGYDSIASDGSRLRNARIHTMAALVAALACNAMMK